MPLVSHPAKKNTSARFKRCLHGLSLWTGLVCLGLSGLAHADLYRWTTKDGDVHFGDNMPSSQARDGYDVIDPKSGEVIRHVDRAKTPQELAAEAAAKAAEEQVAEKKHEEEEAQAQRDHMLLNLYSNTADVERARDQRLGEIDALIKQTEGAIERANDRYQHSPNTSEQKSAFKDVVQLRKNLFDLQERRNESAKRFEEDLQRFKQLHADDKPQPAGQ